MNAIADLIRSALPAGRRKIGSGWESFNCPCCVAMGETRPDTRNRGGIIFTSDGGFSYHCFNCKIKVHWEPGSFFGKRQQLFAKCLGLSTEQIRKLKFNAWRLRNQIDLKIEVDYKSKWTDITFSESSLPDGALAFDQLMKSASPPSGFLNALQYLQDRDEYLVNACTYYWSPSLKHDMNRRIIIPFYWQDKIVGYAGRLITGKPNRNTPRYYGKIPENYLFNNKVLYSKDRVYVVVVEGVLDAIAVDGLGLLGSTVSGVQVDWINSSGLEPILVPDRDRAGDGLMDIAIEQGWSVSFPQWEDNVGDVADAVSKYGRLFTLKGIIDNKETSRVAINVRRKKWCN